jgi:hypothetical protein
MELLSVSQEAQLPKLQTALVWCGRVQPMPRIDRYCATEAHRCALHTPRTTPYCKTVGLAKVSTMGTDTECPERTQHPEPPHHLTHLPHTHAS